jgi:hypothetical protein
VSVVNNVLALDCGSGPVLDTGISQVGVITVVELVEVEDSVGEDAEVVH